MLVKAKQCKLRQFTHLKIICTLPIVLFHNGGQIKYSFVLMLISPTSLATKSKFQKNIYFKTRAVGLINIKTKECKSGRHLWKWSIQFLLKKKSRELDFSNISGAFLIKQFFHWTWDDYSQLGAMHLGYQSSHIQRALME